MHVEETTAPPLPFVDAAFEATPPPPLDDFDSEADRFSCDKIVSSGDDDASLLPFLLSSALSIGLSMSERFTPPGGVQFSLPVVAFCFCTDGNDGVLFGAANGCCCARCCCESSAYELCDLTLARAAFRLCFCDDPRAGCCCVFAFSSISFERRKLLIVVRFENHDEDDNKSTQYY
jgi:hypothetical protein